MQKTADAAVKQADYTAKKTKNPVYRAWGPVCHPVAVYNIIYTCENSI